MGSVVQAGDPLGQRAEVGAPPVWEEGQEARADEDAAIATVALVLPASWGPCFYIISCP